MREDFGQNKDENPSQTRASGQKYNSLMVRPDYFGQQCVDIIKINETPYSSFKNNLTVMKYPV